MTLNPLIGIGLRVPHYQQVLECKPKVGWFEVHSENFLYTDSPAASNLLRIRKNYPISLHGVGLSLGSSHGIESAHLHRLKTLVSLIEPMLVSEHLSWSMVDGHFLPDLLPIPYNHHTMQTFIRNITLTQDFLKRNILIENPSSYLEYSDSSWDEADFLVTLCQITGAQILLDVNNIYVSSVNHGWDAKKYIDTIPTNLVGEIHLAGHSQRQIAEDQILCVDTHDNFVCKEVWDLYAYTVNRLGNIHTLLEWDDKIPDFSILVKEAAKAEQYLQADKKYANA